MDEQKVIIFMESEISKYFNVEKDQVKILEMPPAVAKEESQLSVLRRVKYRIKKRNEECTEGSFILKFIPMEAVIPPIVEQFFETEVYIYTKIMHVIEEMRASKKFPPLFPAFVANLTKRSLLIEDLCSSGYDKALRAERLGVKEGKVAFRSLGQLHAVSWIAQSQGKIDLGKIQTSPLFTHGEWRDGYITAASSALVISMKKWGSEWAKRADDLGEFIIRSKDEICAVYSDDQCKFKVLCHGDPWTGNILFQKDKNGDIKGVRFIDFQLAHYGSYYWDLLYLIANGISFSARSQVSEMADEYAEGLKETFETFDVTPPYFPSADDVKKQLKLVHDYIFLLTVACGPRQAYGSDDLLTNFEGEGDPSFLRVYQNPNVQRELKTYLNENINIIS